MARYIDADALIEDIQETICAKCGDICDGIKCKSCGIDDTLDLLENAPTADVVPKSEVEKLELTLQGVMWSVDKWLDENDYDADPIKRAITMREKTLKIVENAKSEVARDIFEEIEKRSSMWGGERHINYKVFDYLKKKYTEGET